MNYKKYLFVGLLLIGLALAIAACSSTDTHPLWSLPLRHVQPAQLHACLP